jgi:hypothetical protein
MFRNIGVIYSNSSSNNNWITLIRKNAVWGVEVDKSGHSLAPLDGTFYSFSVVFSFKSFPRCM